MVEFLDYITLPTLLLSKSLTDEIKIQTLGNAEFFTVSCEIALYEGYSEEKLIMGLNDYGLI